MSRKELHTLIKDVREMFEVRLKLGAFDNLEHSELKEWAEAMWVMGMTTPRRYSELLLIELQNITPDDIKSFYPLYFIIKASIHIRTPLGSEPMLDILDLEMHKLFGWMSKP